MNERPKLGSEQGGLNVHLWVWPAVGRTAARPPTLDTWGAGVSNLHKDGDGANSVIYIGLPIAGGTSKYRNPVAHPSVDNSRGIFLSRWNALKGFATGRHDRVLTNASPAI